MASSDDFAQADPFRNGHLRLDPNKQKEFFKLVQEKYNGDLYAALRRAIDYFLVYEKSANLKRVSETLQEIQSKILRIKEMSSQISDTMKTINETNARLREARDAQEAQEAKRNGAAQN
ncbi:MAG: hypothetical protein RMI34_05290 [Chloroherpetonaceae bacterium]|nr:hypothetical protein [Chloroherpetonaceae bacterium]MCS7210416.1 hypothetical protein [Chloroherpetonaceae bacterium]MDW8019473.1 hypothetical protein [Chloroherpetonaceae bacterium]MDW8465585.1 hypothetical protein [Chloroherpetonaceae bacterium]